MTEQVYDFLIVGAGIAGASVGFHLAARGSVCLLEMESQPGYHTTGRSAAFYCETYGGPMVRPLTSASKAFLKNPPPGFTDVPLAARRGAIHVFDKARQARGRALYRDWVKTVPDISLLGRGETLALQPGLREDLVAGAIFDPGCDDLDVAAIHQGYLRGLKARGGTLMPRTEFCSAVRQRDHWVIETGAGPLGARTLINTAGAWADQTAERAGLTGLGLLPLRRTLITVPRPEGMPPRQDEPLTLDLDEKFYFKTEGADYLITPADETLCAPGDVQPEVEDIARAVASFEAATGAPVTRVNSKWAGLRTFAPDRAPVIGYDPRAEGFFWSAGQGGYGIQTVDAWSRIAASLLTAAEVDADLTYHGVNPAAYTPARFLP